MSFDRPQLLWLLAATLPLAAAFLFRRRRTRVAVPDLAAWISAAAGRPPRGWRELRDAGTLALNLLAAAALALAAAGPRPAGPPPQDWALVFDVSASMGARDGRFRKSLEIADAFARSLSGRDRVRVFEAGEVARAAGGWRRGGEGLPDVSAPEEAWADLAGALEMARGARTVVFSDRAAPGAEFAPLVAERTDNVAVESAAFARERGADRVRVEARVANRGALPAAPAVALEAQGGAPVRARRDQALAARTSEALGFDVDSSEGGEFRVAASTAPPDALAADDIAYLVVPPRTFPRVLVGATRDSPFLRSALAALGTDIDATSGLTDPRSAASDDADVRVFDRCAPEGPWRGPSIHVAPPGPGSPVLPGAEAAAPAITGWAADHPLLAGLDLSRLRVSRARPFASVPGQTPLVDSAEGPLAVAGESGGGRFVALAFALEDSNFPLLAAFPIFVRNCVDELARPRVLPPARVGDWVAPFEGAFEVWRGGAREAAWGAWRADRPGVLVFRQRDAALPMAVNLFRPEESGLDAPPPGRELPAIPPEPPPPWMLLAGLAALAAAAGWLTGRRG
jgi:hypothetical protein